MRVDKNNRWLFYVEGGKRKVRGRWYLSLFALAYLTSWVLLIFAMRTA
jgi:hypothetical protein